MSVKLYRPEEALCRRTVESLPSDDQAYKDKVYERLMSRCETDHVTECMIYLGCWSDRGVGRVRVGQRVYNIAKVAAWIFHGVPLFRDVAYHTCSSPACFNPEHVGTQATVSLAFAARYHAHRRGRQTDATAARPGRRLSFDKATTIRARLSQGESVEALAHTYRVSRAAIIAIWNGDSWRPRDNHEPATRRAA